MLYSDLISALRAEAKDLAKAMHNDFTGDGVTTLFQCTDAPILESNYIVRVAAVQKTEGVDYSIDREQGLITFATPPGNGVAVAVDYKYVNVTNASWITIINEVISDMEGDYFKEITDDDFEDTVSEQETYAAPTGCIDVVNWFYRTSENSDWQMMKEYSNWRYSKDTNSLYLGRVFFTEYQTKLHYLKGYVRGTTIDSTLDVQSIYEGVLRLGCLWKYYNYRLADRVETTTKVAAERTITPLQNIQMLVSHYFKLYDLEKRRKKPTKPMRILTVRNNNGGTP